MRNRGFVLVRQFLTILSRLNSRMDVCHPTDKVRSRGKLTWLRRGSEAMNGVGEDGTRRSELLWDAHYWRCISACHSGWPVRLSIFLRPVPKHSRFLHGTAERYSASSLATGCVCLLNIMLFLYMAFDDERVLLVSPLAADYQAYRMRAGMFLPRIRF